MPPEEVAKQERRLFPSSGQSTHCNADEEEHLKLPEPEKAVERRATRGASVSRTVYGVGLLIILLVSGAAIIGFAMLTIKMPPN